MDKEEQFQFKQIIPSKYVTHKENGRAPISDKTSLVDYLHNTFSQYNIYPEELV